MKKLYNNKNLALEVITFRNEIMLTNSFFRWSSFFFIVFIVSFTARIGNVEAQQNGEGLSVDTFKPSSSTNSIFELTLVEPKKHLEWSASGLAFYSHRLVRRERLVELTGETDEIAYPVNTRLNLDLMFALGLWDLFEIGLAVPVIIFQTGEGGEPDGSIQRAGLGDPRLDLKARLVDAGAFQGGLGLTATAPLGHYLSSGMDLLGYVGPTVEPKILADLTMGPVLIAFNGGFLLRPFGTLADYEQNYAVTWNAAAAFDLKDFMEPGGLRLAVETNGEVGIGFHSLVETPMEALAGVKYRTQKDLIFSAGAGGGISTAVGTPAFRIFFGLAYDSLKRSCQTGPEDFDGFEDNDNCMDPDNDQDGLLDEIDDCPNSAEDLDGYQDDDGCPDWDNDGDGVPDQLDSCPMIPEDKDDYEDEDGCPEEGPGKPTVKITDTQLLLSSKIYFDFNKVVVNKVSYPILDALAEALVSNSYIKKVRVEGHTDNEGTAEYNMDLSKQRAKAVVDYLIDKGVDSARLAFEGYGLTMPKASNQTEEGRAINRRVEFTILDKE